MSSLQKRILIDFAVTIVFGVTLVALTEKWWIPLVMFPYSMWNFYDGATRAWLDE
jgi:hypothetical protein